MLGRDPDERPGVSCDCAGSNDEGPGRNLPGALVDDQVTWS